MALHDFKISELSMLSDLARFQSLRVLALHYRVDVSHVSRLIKILEEDFSRPLIQRSPRGYTITPTGESVAAIAQSLLKEYGKLLELETGRKHQAPRKTLVVGAQGFLNMIFAGCVVEATDLKKWAPCFLDLNLDELLIATHAGATDLQLHFGAKFGGEQWITQSVGSVRWGFYASPKQPGFKSKMKAAELTEWMAVAEAAWDGTKVNRFDQIVPSSCPFEIGCLYTETAVAAISTASKCKAIAYVPDIVVSQLRSDLVERIDVVDVEISTKELFLTANSTKLSEAHLKRIVLAIKKSLAN